MILVISFLLFSHMTLHLKLSQAELADKRLLVDIGTQATALGGVYLTILEKRTQI